MEIGSVIFVFNRQTNSLIELADWSRVGALTNSGSSSTQIINGLKAMNAVELSNYGLPDLLQDGAFYNLGATVGTSWGFSQLTVPILNNILQFERGLGPLSQKPLTELIGASITTLSPAEAIKLMQNPYNTPLLMAGYMNYVAGGGLGSNPYSGLSQNLSLDDKLTAVAYSMKMDVFVLKAGNDYTSNTAPVLTLGVHEGDEGPTPGTHWSLVGMGDLTNDTIRTAVFQMSPHLSNWHKALDFQSTNGTWNYNADRASLSDGFVGLAIYDAKNFGGVNNLAAWTIGPFADDIVTPLTTSEGFDILTQVISSGFHSVSFAFGIGKSVTVDAQRLSFFGYDDIRVLTEESQGRVYETGIFDNEYVISLQSDDGISEGLYLNKSAFDKTIGATKTALNLLKQTPQASVSLFDFDTDGQLSIQSQMFNGNYVLSLSNQLGVSPTKIDLGGGLFYDSNRNYTITSKPILIDTAAVISSPLGMAALTLSANTAGFNLTSGIIANLPSSTPTLTLASSR